MYSIVLPIYWTKEFVRKPPKTVLVGMSWFRNAFHIDQNKWKREFHDLVFEQLEGIHPPKLEKFSIELDIYYKNASCDPSNISPLIEKCVLDAFQKADFIQNDNAKYHVSTLMTVIGQDKCNPRCMVRLISKE